MLINIYSTYKVEVSTHHSYRVDFDDFRESCSTGTMKLNGKELIKLISNAFNEEWVNYIGMEESSFVVDCFNPMTGECGSSTYTITEIKSY